MAYTVHNQLAEHSALENKCKELQNALDVAVKPIEKGIMNMSLDMVEVMEIMSHHVAEIEERLKDLGESIDKQVASEFHLV